MNLSLKEFKKLAKLLEKEEMVGNEWAWNDSTTSTTGNIEITSYIKPYLSVRMVNDVLTVVMTDGNIVTKTGATVEDYKAVTGAKTVEELLSVISSAEAVKEMEKVKKEQMKNINIQKGLNLLKNFPEEFEIKDECVYLKGINRSIPQLLVEKFAEVISKCNDWALDEEFQSLKKFWLKCCLNPSAQSAEDLYTFLSHHQFKIDKHGNFYAYRRVVSNNDKADKELVDFISNAYNKVKAVWKKSPSDYDVLLTDGEYIIQKSGDITGKTHYGNVKSNLKEIYLNLPNMKENSYTDAHTHTFIYRVGDVMSMPRDKGDDNNQVNCSKGFHSVSKEYDYSGFGDTPILMIINPIDVLAVPLNEIGKMRVCRWFFAMTLPEDEQFILDDDDFDVTELGDVFEEKCMNGLTEHVQNGFAEEVKRHTFNTPAISATDVKNIVSALEEMSEVISKRVNKIN